MRATPSRAPCPPRAVLDAAPAALPLELPLAHDPELARSRERLVRRARPRVSLVPGATADGHRRRRSNWATATLRLDPQTVVLTFASQPSGLQLAVNGISSATPFTRTVIVGSTNSLSAPTPQIAGWDDLRVLLAGRTAARRPTTSSPRDADDLHRDLHGRSGGLRSTYLSDLTWTSMTNGWGPVEKDMSNGESGEGDGATTHAERHHLRQGPGHARGLRRALRDLQLHPLQGRRGSRRRGRDPTARSSSQVFAGATKIYDSGPMTGATATKPIDVSIAGAS